MARELHDSVTQSVLSIGMTIEVCRAELESMGGPAGQIAERLLPARDLTRHVAEQLRAAIYALHQAAQRVAGPAAGAAAAAVQPCTGPAGCR